MSAEIITYGLHGVSVQESSLLKSMIERTVRRLGQPVIYTPIEFAQIVFFDGPPPELNSPGSRLIQLARDNGARQSANTLRMPPHVTDILEIFGRFTQETSHALTDCGLAKQLTGTLYNLFRHRGSPHALVNDAGSGLMLFPENRQFSWLGEDANKPIADFFQPHGLSGLSLRALNNDQIDAVANRQGIERMFWHVGLAHAKCGLLPWVPVDNILRMRVWPYLAAQGPATSIKLATLLRAQPRSFSALVADAGIPEADVTAFVNAALLCGFVAGEIPVDTNMALSRSKGSNNAHRPVRGAGVSGLLDAIRGALRMRS
ncbi:MAG: hypothetical protein ACYDEV_07250 [Acidiferrobacter sp.]